MLILASIANADDRNQRRDDRNTSGRIAWSTRDRFGNRFGISFDFGGRSTGFNVDYRQDRYGRERYRRGEYDHHRFGSYQEWNDWRQWQSQWDHHRGWSHNDRGRNRSGDRSRSGRRG